MSVQSDRDSKTERIKKALSSFAVNREYLSSKGKDEDESEKQAIENGLLSRLIFEREKRLTNIYTIMILVDTVLVCLYYGNDGLNSPLGSIWLPVSYCLHVYSVFTLILLFRLEYQKIPENHKYEFSIPFAILRVIVNFMLHPAPWLVQTTFEISYDDYGYNNLSMPLKMNYVLVLLALVKNMLHVFVKMLVNTSFVGPRARRIKRIYTVDSVDQVYAFRCIFVESPIKLVFGLYVMGYTFFSFAFKITESGVPINGNPFIYFENCLWLTFITNTTVGYGDVRIFTHIGYIVGVCCMVWGTLIISCILVVLINTLSLNSSEVKTLTQVNRLEGQFQYNQLCKQFIRISLWRLWKNHKNGLNQKSSSQERKMRADMKRMRSKNRSYNATTNIVQMAQLQFDNARQNTEYLCSNNIHIINFISNHIFSSEIFERPKSNASVDSAQQPKQLIPSSSSKPSNFHLLKRKNSPLIVEDLSFQELQTIRIHQTQMGLIQ